MHAIRSVAPPVALLVVLALVTPAEAKNHRPSLSPMGQAAKKRAAAAQATAKAVGDLGLAARAAAPAAAATAAAIPAIVTAKVLGDRPEEEEEVKGCVNEPECPGEDEDAAEKAPGGQAETTIAVSDNGRHVVVGFNDTRGFSLNPISVSGFQYSDDGGKTFVDGTQLPAPPQFSLGGQLFPQVFGDPDVKWLGGCNFVYSSILVTVKQFTVGTTVFPPTLVQTMSLHRSQDCGHTWEGPFEVTAASNPNGLIFSDGSAVDAADKEFIDYDPRSGRLIMTWTNFTHPLVAPGGIQMLSTFTDDVMAPGGPTFADPSLISAVEADGQASIPRFGFKGKEVYVSWRRFPGGNDNVTAFARSEDGGETWEAPVVTSAPFFTMDYVLGNDRVNTSPSMAVDLKGKNHGNIYLVYANNDSGDGADIAFQRSTDGGKTWSTPRLINSRPGDDRAQWFPWVTVDNDTGRVFVFFYDQGVAESGDETQVTYTYSDDAGKHWHAPLALSDRTFHAGWGNDTGQPNLGDYNQAVAMDGKLWASYALASRPPGGFVDGQPTTQLTVPDLVVAVLPGEGHRYNAAPLEFAGYELSESGHNGFLDPGELFTLRVKLRNAVTNPLSAETLEEIVGTLRNLTPGIDVLIDRSAWQRLSPGEVRAGIFPFLLWARPSFVHGTPIELQLDVRSDDHQSTRLLFTVQTGTPLETLLLSENFNGAPAGWTTVHGAGTTTVPWTLVSGSPAALGFCGTRSGAAFHQNANDNPGGSNQSRWERLFSPAFAVPADAEYVTVEFDICTDTEDDPAFNILAYDGFFLRIADLTTGHTLRSVLAEAFADQFTTDGFKHYPKHLPRNSNASYFPNGDMSAWAGDSGGIQHVKMQLPGMAGTTAQLRFEFAQDANTICSDLRPGHACGVLLDNVVVKSFKTASRQPH
jgi:hypothetical protein